MDKGKVRGIVNDLKRKSSAWNSVVSYAEKKWGIWYGKYRDAKYQLELAWFYLELAIKW